MYKLTIIEEIFNDEHTQLLNHETKNFSDIIMLLVYIKNQYKPEFINQFINNEYEPGVYETTYMEHFHSDCSDEVDLPTEVVFTLMVEKVVQKELLEPVSIML